MPCGLHLRGLAVNAEYFTAAAPEVGDHPLVARKEEAADADLWFPS
ncbi:hypothetical protein K4B79_45910 [Streptomyces lincolnensis]|nr:hypothetical protein [Streptomyces lincolnensis]MCD7445500.1 hypothetical protein [Streptomyces lincolnensis]